MWLPAGLTGVWSGAECANQDPVSRLARLAWAWGFWNWPLSPARGPCTLPRHLPPGPHGLRWPWCLPQDREYQQPPRPRTKPREGPNPSHKRVGGQAPPPCPPGKVEAHMVCGRGSRCPEGKGGSWAGLGRLRKSTRVGLLWLPQTLNAARAAALLWPSGSLPTGPAHVFTDTVLRDAAVAGGLCGCATWAVTSRQPSEGPWGVLAALGHTDASRGGWGQGAWRSLAGRGPTADSHPSPAWRGSLY